MMQHQQHQLLLYSRLSVDCVVPYQSLHTVEKGFTKNEKVEILVDADLLKNSQNGHRVHCRYQSGEDETIGSLQLIQRSAPPGNARLGWHAH